MRRLEKNWIEWVVFFVGLVLVASVLSYLAYDATSIGNAPPNIQVRLGPPKQGPSSFIVPVTLSNLGDHTAAEVQVEVVLEQSSGEKERAELAIAFLPRGGTREGWVTFRTDPGKSKSIEAHVLGYEAQ